jgi:hypothetical protein
MGGSIGSILDKLPFLVTSIHDQTSEVSFCSTDSYLEVFIQYITYRIVCLFLYSIFFHTSLLLKSIIVSHSLDTHFHLFAFTLGLSAAFYRTIPFNTNTES